MGRGNFQWLSFATVAKSVSLIEKTYFDFLKMFTGNSKLPLSEP